MDIKFSVQGMSCAACATRVEKVAKAVQGVTNAEVNLLSGTLVVKAQDERVVHAIITAVSTAGYSASAMGEKAPVKQAPSKDSSVQKRLLCSAVFLVALMYFTMGHMLHLPLPRWYTGTENALVAALLQFLLTVPVIVLNRAYYQKGLRSLIKRNPNMDSLIAVGSGAALIYGVFVLFRMAYAFGHGDLTAVEHYMHNLYFESAAMILTLITFGKFLESRAKGRASDAVRQLMDLAPKNATVLRDGVEVEISCEDVQVGDIVTVRSGGRIQVDGTVISGYAAVDESPITGESVPVDKLQGGKVTAGTICTEGYLQFRADAVGENTTLAQVIRFVEEAGGTKAPIARLADKIAGIFVPVVMAIALLTAACWLIAGKTFEFALSNGICVLVISCPCALGLATPVAIMVGTGRGARMGVLFKNAQALENLHRIDTVVLDKTGTLTAGKPEVTHILPQNMETDEFLRITASLEAHSEHPFAKAIMAKAEDMSLFELEDFEVLPGRGVSGTIKGIKYHGGNAALMQSIGVQIPDCSRYAQQGGTPLFFAKAQTFLGCIIAADVIREDAKSAVEKLQKLHLKLVMLTGDNRETAAAIAHKAGIRQVISDVLPTEKAGAVQQLQEKGHRVLMVGDGINDAPALVTADVGMAIGAGTDIAMESADVVLMNSALSGIYNAISLSKATIRNIKQNLFWAFFYNILGIPVAAGVLYPAFGVLLSPMIGAAAMSFSSVFVVTNALRLRFFKAERENQKKVMQKEVVKMETVIYVEGMMCSHCKARVESVCREVAGAADAVVDLQKKSVTVTGSAERSALEEAIKKAGYDVVG